MFFSPKDAKSITVEVALLKAVQHANVVRLFASYLVQDQLWLVMELMDGGDLTGRIEAKAPFTEVVSFLTSSHKLPWLPGISSRP